MTISSEIRKAGPYNGNGATTSFPFAFKVFSKADIEVVRTSPAGAETALVLDSDYSVALNADQDNNPGGTITYPISGTALGAGYKLTIIGAVPYTQVADITNAGAFYPQVIENALDRSTIQIQQIRELQSRAITVAVSDTVDVSLPPARPNTIIGWNDDGTALENFDPSAVSATIVYGTSRADTFTGNGTTTAFTLTESPGALNNLDVSISGVVQVPGVDYTWPGGTSLVTASPVPNGAVLLVKYKVALAQGTLDAASVSFAPTGTISATNVQDALAEVAAEAGGGGGGSSAPMPTLKNDYAAAGDGTTDDTAHITSAAAAGNPVFAELGNYKNSVNWSTNGGNFWGVGNLKDTAGDKRARFFTSIAAAPSTTVNDDSVVTAFNGDWSHNFFNLEHRISGATTLGQPTTGYLYRNEAYPFYMYLYNASGHNQSTSGNVGRTAACGLRVKADQYGQGDVVAYNATANVFSTKTGTTDFLANPAAVLFNGTCSIFATGGYANPGEFDINDNGYDAAAIGWVINCTRTVKTGAKNAFWSGIRIQSIGSQQIDTAFTAVGPVDIGLDLGQATINTSTKAAAALPANSRIYFNSSKTGGGYVTNAFGTEYITYTSANSTLSLAVGDVPMVQVKSTQALVAGTFFVSHSSVNKLTVNSADTWIDNTLLVRPSGTTRLDVSDSRTRITNPLRVVPNGGSDSSAVITADSSRVYLGNTGAPVEINQTLRFTTQTVGMSASAGGGGASALPATPFGYMSIYVDNIHYKIPIYQP